jgi:hypothetical protein
VLFMKRFIGLGVAAVAGIALTVLLSTIGGAPKPVGATGTGGTIALGSPTGLSIPVDTTVATDPYSGFNIHVTTSLFGAVSLTNITADATGSTIDAGAGSLFCTSSAFSGGGRVVGCVALSSGQWTTAAGLLDTLTLVATGDGCIAVQLATTGQSDANLDTFTINADDNSAQANVVDTTAVPVPVGTGTVEDCAGQAATATPTDTPTPVDTPTPAGTATNTPTATPCVAAGCPTVTPSPTLTPGAPLKGTLTPTGTPATATSTATVTDTPGPQPPVGVTPPGNAESPGAARTGIHLPDTGDGSGAGGSGGIWLAVSIAAAALGASAVVLSRRRA